MKKLILFSILVLGTLQCIAQTWSPVVKGTKLNYGTGNTISYTVWVDSTAYSATDSTYYMNKTVLTCKTCPNTQNYYSILLKNQGSFLLKNIRFSSSLTRLYQDDKHARYLSNNRQTGNTWVFDSLANIQATVIGLRDTLLWTQTDSIEQISLSNGRAIILSQSHGVLTFPDLDYAGQLNLIGMEPPTSTGVQTPMFNDLFSYTIGDVLEYYIYAADRYPEHEIYQLCTITNKTVTPSSITFQMSIVQQDIQYWYGGSTINMVYSQFQYSDILNTSDSSIYQGYANMPILRGGCLDYTPIRTGWNDTFQCQTKSYTYLTQQINGDTMGSLITNQPVFICTETNDPDITYGSGVGLIHSFSMGFNTGSGFFPYHTDKYLIAATIGNKTFSTFVPVPLGITEIEKPLTRFYPNPCTGSMSISCDKPISALKVYDLTGQLLLSDYPKAEKTVLTMQKPGIYFVKISCGTSESIEKVVFY
jgi:hypothetical protein